MFYFPVQKTFSVVPRGAGKSGLFADQAMQNHFHNLPCGASLILGCNGYVWVAPFLNGWFRAEPGGGFQLVLKMIFMKNLAGGPSWSGSDYLGKMPDYDLRYDGVESVWEFADIWSEYNFWFVYYEYFGMIS